MWEPTVLNILPFRPSGVHAVNTILAPGRATRASSPAASRWRGANITPKQDVTRSNDASSNGSSSASPSTKRTSRPASAARTRAASSSRGVRSRPVTLDPASAAGIATLPVPVATSSRLTPGAACARSTTSSATPAIVREISA